MPNLPQRGEFPAPVRFSLSGSHEDQSTGNKAGTCPSRMGPSSIDAFQIDPWWGSLWGFESQFVTRSYALVVNCSANLSATSSTRGPPTLTTGGSGWRFPTDTPQGVEGWTVQFLYSRHP